MRQRVVTELVRGPSTFSGFFAATTIHPFARLHETLPRTLGTSAAGVVVVVDGRQRGEMVKIKGWGGQSCGK
jgi:hypothetical protein